MMNRICKYLVVSSVAVAAFCSTASAGFKTFVIRNAGDGTSPGIEYSRVAQDAYEFTIDKSGMKAGLGTNDINGITIGEITRLAITRHDDVTRYSAGSGPAVAPYFNIWVTDGTNYATIANTPSSADFQPLMKENADGTWSYDLTFADLANKRAQVYETQNGGYNSTNTWVHAAVGKTGELLTFADVAGLLIAPPTPEYTTASSYIGSGAADEIDTNIACGFNWVFGDTLSNYVSDGQGYIVSGYTATPEPATMSLLALGGIAVLRRKRKK